MLTDHISEWNNIQYATLQTKLVRTSWSYIAETFFLLFLLKKKKVAILSSSKIKQRLSGIYRRFIAVSGTDLNGWIFVWSFALQIIQF